MNVWIGGIPSVTIIITTSVAPQKNNNQLPACDQCTHHDDCDDNVFDTHWKMCTHRLVPFPGHLFLPNSVFFSSFLMSTRTLYVRTPTHTTKYAIQIQLPDRNRFSFLKCKAFHIFNGGTDCVEGRKGDSNQLSPFGNVYFIGPFENRYSVREKKIFNEK